MASRALRKVGAGNARFLARQALEDEFFHTSIPSIARKDISLRIGDEDVQPQEHPGKYADMAKRRLRDLLQGLAVQNTNALLMTFADIDEALIPVG